MFGLARSKSDQRVVQNGRVACANRGGDMESTSVQPANGCAVSMTTAAFASPAAGSTCSGRFPVTRPADTSADKVTLPGPVRRTPETGERVPASVPIVRIFEHERAHSRRIAR